MCERISLKSIVSVLKKKFKIDMGYEITTEINKENVKLRYVDIFAGPTKVVCKARIEEYKSEYYMLASEYRKGIVHRFYSPPQFKIYTNEEKVSEILERIEKEVIASI